MLEELPERKAGPIYCAFTNRQSRTVPNPADPNRKLTSTEAEELGIRIDAVGDKSPAKIECAAVSNLWKAFRPISSNVRLCGW